MPDRLSDPFHVLRANRVGVYVLRFHPVEHWDVGRNCAPRKRQLKYPSPCVDKTRRGLGGREALLRATELTSVL